MDLTLIRIIAGLVMLLVGGYLTYTAWQRFNTNFKTAERLAPVVLNAGIAALGLIVLFFTFEWWLVAVAAVLLVLGSLMKGPVKPTYR